MYPLLVGAHSAHKGMAFPRAMSSVGFMRLLVLLGFAFGCAVQAQTLPSTHQNFAACPVGWNGTAGGSCLLLVILNGTKVTWDEAEQNCVQQGGHLASASTLSEWQDINATCASSGQSDCWFGARQLLNQRTPSTGWYWQDCMAQKAVPWDSLVPSSFQWRGIIAGVATTAEPNDYNSTDGSYGTERNNENCAKWEGGQILDYVCSPVMPITPTAYVCSKSRYCGVNATSVSSGSGPSATCTCACLPGYVGDGQSCKLNATANLSFPACPDGWTRTAGGSCLRLFTNATQVTWDTAEQNCVQEGGHLASASTPSQWQDINATCAGSNQSDCWFGARQLLNQATPSTGWYWQDCMAQKAVPWDSLVPSAFQWRGIIAGVATTTEPNDYNSLNGSYGIEQNNENCAKWEGGQILDYVCSPVMPITPTAYVCGKSPYCGLNATSVSSGSGPSATCTCACLPGYVGDGQSCTLNATANATANLSLAFPQPPRNVCSTSPTETPPLGNIVSNNFSNGVPVNWFCPFCSGNLTNQTDSTGTFAVLTAQVRGGKEDAAVGVQVNNLVANQSHYFSAWVRTRGATNQTNRGVIVFGSHTLQNGSFQGGPFCMAPVAQIQNDCWSLVVGAFTPPNSTQMIRIGIADTKADIHVLSIAVVPRTPLDLRTEQNARISQWRKANLQLSFRRNGSSVNGTYSLEPVRSGFPWGIQDLDYGVVTDKALQDFVVNTFRASAVGQGNSGWPATESGPNQTDYSGAEKFIAWAQSANLSVWGPQVTWDDTKNGIPTWVQQQVSAGANLDSLIAQRSTNAMTAGNGRYATVTVDNEGLHNTYIPTNGNGTESIVKCFTDVRSADLAIGYSTPIIFNEYNVGESCYYNLPADGGGDSVSPDDFIARINFLNSQGSGQLVNIAGLQFQITPNENEAQRMSIAVDYIHNRTGLPVHLTEFNVNTMFDEHPVDRTYQADIMETSLRQLFSNRHVAAILFQHIIPNSYGGDTNDTCSPCLFLSGTYTPNVAGVRYLQLREEWSTRVANGTIDANGNATQVRAFHGTYRVGFNDPNGNAAPFQTITVDNDNGTLATQYVVVNV